MTITPFLPGLPTPAAPDGGTPGEVPAGDVGAAFGEALAAALAGSLVVPTTAPPAPPVAAAAASPVAAPVADPVADPVAAPVAAPVVEVRRPFRSDLPAPSLETSGPAAPAVPSAAPASVPAPQPEVSRLGDARTSTAEKAEEPGLVTVAARPPRPPADDIAAPTQTSAPSSVLPTITATLAPTTTPVLDLTPDAVGKAVVQQVFPEVTRLASTAGNGTHRITLTLQPEQLGEVRVTLVVRDGSVHVRLAGGAGVDGVDGAAVHRALAGGAPELQRLLERTGAEARVSVRDPFAAALPTLTGPTSSTAPQPVLPTTGGQPGLQTGPDAQSRSDPQARHDGQPAREQPTRDQPRQHQPRPSAYPVEPVPVPSTGRLDRTV